MRDADNHRERSGWMRLRRFFLVNALIACLAGAGYLGYLGVLEYRERQAGVDFYAELSATAGNTASAQRKTTETQPAQKAYVAVPETASPLLEKTPSPTVQLNELPHPTAQPGEMPLPTVQPGEMPLLTAQPGEASGNGEIVAALIEAAQPLSTVRAQTWDAPAVAQLSTQQPVPEPTPFVNRSEIDFPTLWQTCPDVVGWIRIEDTVIDYPIVLGEDNDFYLEHLPDGTSNKAGSIMMDQANSGKFLEAVNILHGHHMRNDTMFGRLDDYAKEKFYQAHAVIQLFTPAGDYDVAVFAACTVNGYTFGYPTFFEDEAAFMQFIRKAVSATPYETEIEVEYGDRILLLSTCAYSYSGARYVVMGKILEPEQTETCQGE